MNKQLIKLMCNPKLELVVTTMCIILFITTINTDGDVRPVSDESGVATDNDMTAEPDKMLMITHSRSDVFPDTTGEDLWSFIVAKYKNWSLWPGKDKFFKGESPHGALLTVYVDSLVYNVLNSGAQKMPARSIIVKENYDSNKTLKTHTVMYKVPGYSPEHQDWFWGWYSPDGKVLAAGRVKACYQCHDVAKQYDDLWILRDQNYLKTIKSH